MIAAGAPAYFLGSFSLGMDVADTFGVSGGVHVPIGNGLYAVSGVAVLVLAVIAIRRAVNRKSARVRVGSARSWRHPAPAPILAPSGSTR